MYSSDIVHARRDLEYSVFASDHRITRSLFLAGLAILVFDHLLTLEMEVKLIWSSKLRPSTSWFFAVRYIGLGATLAMLPYYFGESNHESCVKMEWAWQLLILGPEILIEITLALRVIAMYGFNRIVFFCFLSATAALVAVFLWAEISYGEKPHMLEAPGLSGCHAAFTRSSAIRPATIWELILVFDTLVFGLTVRRAYQRRSLPMYSGSLMQRMATDGSMYFGIIVLSNLANVLSFYFGDVLLVGLLSWFTTNLSTTLLCRLMLNLHEAGAVAGMETDARDLTQMNTLRFTMPGAAGEG